MINSFKALLRTLKFISDHPLNKSNRSGSILRYLGWQVSSRIIQYPIIYPFTENTKLIISKGKTGVTGNYYCGLHDFEEMSFVLHALREGDLFVDVGANLGSYSILAAGEAQADVVAIEPIKLTFNGLEENILINDLKNKIKAINIAFGRVHEIRKFTRLLDTTNHAACDNENDTVDVMVERFDDIVSMTSNTFVKIDVEGFESEVLAGMDRSLSNPMLKGIIIESNDSGKRYGYDNNLVQSILINKGFEQYKYYPFVRDLVKSSSNNLQNAIYLRDIGLIRERIETARKVKILKKEF
jgi:FkbM family methyltransferase